MKLEGCKFERPQISKYTCNCSPLEDYKWIEINKDTKECPYCGTKLEPEVVHRERKYDVCPSREKTLQDKVLDEFLAHSERQPYADILVDPSRV